LVPVKTRVGALGSQPQCAGVSDSAGRADDAEVQPAPVTDRVAATREVSVSAGRPTRMTSQHITLAGGLTTGRGRSLNPFVILDDATGFISFAEQVFDATEVADARTPTPAGRLIHAELQVGDSLLLLADAQEGWGTHPGMFQVWVFDVEAVLARAVERGADIVTPPTPFYGSLTLARVQDPWDNLWWLYQPVPGQPDPKPAWEGGPDTIFRTLDEHLRSTR